MAILSATLERTGSSVIGRLLFATSRSPFFGVGLLHPVSTLAETRDLRKSGLLGQSALEGCAQGSP